MCKALRLPKVLAREFIAAAGVHFSPHIGMGWRNDAMGIGGSDRMEARPSNHNA
jgi:hypothetical protein